MSGPVPNDTASHPALRGKLSADWWVGCGKCHDATWVDTRHGSIPAKTAAKAAGCRYTKEFGWVCPKCLAEDSKR